MTKFLVFGISLFLLGGGKSEIYRTYIPIVSTPHEKAGYAHNRISDELESELGMHNFHVWNIYPRSSGYIPHFSCEVRTYGAMDDEAQNQFDDLRSYLEEVGDREFVLIFLNEPDLPRQCNRTPWHSAHMYRKVIEIAPNAIVTTPQVTHLDYKEGWVWLKEWYYWIERMGLPKPKIGAIHTYMAEPPNLIIDSFWNNFDVETIWITEFGTANPDLLAEMLETYQSDERVSKYFYFDPVGHDWPWQRLANEDDNSLTELGIVWRDAHN